MKMRELDDCRFYKMVEGRRKGKESEVMSRWASILDVLFWASNQNLEPAAPHCQISMILICNGIVSGPSRKENIREVSKVYSRIRCEERGW